MKFEPIRLSLMAVALAAVGSVSATTRDWTVTSGTVQLQFNEAAGSMLGSSFSRIITPYALQTVPGMDNQAGSLNAAGYVQSTRVLSLGLTDGSVSLGDAQPSAHSKNALVDFRRTVFDENGADTNYAVFMKDWDIDLGTSTVYAQVYTRHGNDEAQYMGWRPVFSASLRGFSQGTEGKIVVDGIDAMGHASALVSGQFNGSLNMNPGTANLILAAWQLPADADAPEARLFRELNWGSVTFSIHLSGMPAVPEPSSYALIGAGLGALSVMKRKRT